jgi:hypothetical protein
MRRILIGRGGHSRLQDLIPETAPPEHRRTLLRYLPARFVAKHLRPLASVPPIKILKISQLLNLREIENRRRQNTPLITTAPRKVKRLNVRHRRRQRRKTQNPSSAQPATTTIETDSNEEVIILSTRSLHAMALRNRKNIAEMARALILARNVLLSDWHRPVRTASSSAYHSRYRLANGFSFLGWTNGIRSALFTCDCQRQTVALSCWKSMSCRQMSLCYSV